MKFPSLIFEYYFLLRAQAIYLARRMHKSQLTWTLKIYWLNHSSGRHVFFKTTETVTQIGTADSRRVIKIGPVDISASRPTNVCRLWVCRMEKHDHRLYKHENVHRNSIERSIDTFMHVCMFSFHLSCGGGTHRAAGTISVHESTSKINKNRLLLVNNSTVRALIWNTYALQRTRLAITGQPSHTNTRTQSI